MATLRDIRRRIKAVQSTSKITKAMKMVAAAKFRKAQQRMLELRPYADRMQSILSSLAGGAEGETHPLLAVRYRKNVEVVVMTSDRGLCGAFNANIMKAAVRRIDELRKEGLEVTISTVGRKARDYFRRRNIAMRKSWSGIAGKISYANAQEIAADIIESYTDRESDRKTCPHANRDVVEQQHPKNRPQRDANRYPNAHSRVLLGVRLLLIVHSA